MTLIRKTWIACVMASGALGSAWGSETFTFHSGALNEEHPLETASFTLTFTTPTPLADGLYNWGANNLGQPNTHLPAGVTFSFSDGYTTLTDPADLFPSFQFTLTGGTFNMINGTLGLSARDPSHYDPYYGHTYFYVGSNGLSQLQDAADPDIIGLDYNGHHIPVAAGHGGTWTYSLSTVPAVPEPASWTLLAAGLAIVGFGRRRSSQPL